MSWKKGGNFAGDCNLEGYLRNGLGAEDIYEDWGKK